MAPAALSYGFRPFFLLAALWAAAAMALWLLTLNGVAMPANAFSLFDWHVHELLYGYLPAVIAGFLLTAVANWTGRKPVAGTPLLLLVLLWFGGRIAILASAWLPALAVALVDQLFLIMLIWLVAGEIRAANNRRNAKLIWLLCLFVAGNILFHWEAATAGAAYTGYGTRIGIGVAIILIMLIGGRIIPMFTRNWLAQRGSEHLPETFNRFDAVAVAVAAAALGAWIAVPQSTATAILGFAAALLQLARLARWAGPRTAREPLLLILHIGYVFVPLGFALMGLAIVRPDLLSASAAVHAWTAGAIGVMTLAVMVRASLGHLGLPLKATPAMTLLFLSLLVAAMIRIAAEWLPSLQMSFTIAGTAWIIAFTGYVVLFGPKLLSDRKPKAA